MRRNNLRLADLIQNTKVPAYTQQEVLEITKPSTLFTSFNKLNSLSIHDIAQHKEILHTVVQRSS